MTPLPVNLFHHILLSLPLYLPTYYCTPTLWHNVRVRHGSRMVCTWGSCHAATLSAAFFSWFRAEFFLLFEGKRATFSNQKKEKKKGKCRENGCFWEGNRNKRIEGGGGEKRLCVGVGCTHQTDLLSSLLYVITNIFHWWLNSFFYFFVHMNYRLLPRQ